MKHFLCVLGICAVSLLGSSSANAFERNPNAIFQRLTQSSINNIANQRQWKSGKATLPALQAPAKADGEVGPVSLYGTLNTPQDETWFYTMNYEYSDNGSISNVNVTIYNAQFKKQKELSFPLELGEDEVMINSVQLCPTLSKKFFDYDDFYEIMVYVHAVTTDYSGHSYTKVYSLRDGHHITDIAGNNIFAINAAPDQWSENYFMAFMREDYVDDNYMLYFDVYRKDDWEHLGATLMHTFELDFKYFAGDGSAFPFLMNAWNGKEMYYAMTRYEKPFFSGEDYVEPEITEDNSFIIDLYNKDFELVKTTVVPIEHNPNYMFTMPGIGLLTGNNDMAFNLFDDEQMPAYILGLQSYDVASDDFITSFLAIDTDGNRLGTIAEDVNDYIWLSDVKGQELQMCFYKLTDDESYFSMVDIPSCTETARINTTLPDGEGISSSIDRVQRGNSYMYVSSLLHGIEDAKGDIYHRLAWFTQDGEFDHYDSVNLGQDIALAQPYVSAKVLNPYLFNTDDDVEYMFLIKRYIAETSSRTNEYFRVCNSKGNILMEIGPDENKGLYISSIMVLNPNSVQAKLVVAYTDYSEYSIDHFDLPLSKFAGGDGSVENPYKITSVGDLSKIYTEPSANYILMNDIDFNYAEFVGNDCYFNGTLDGRGRTIKNMILNGTGLVHNLCDGGIVKDIKFQNCEQTIGEDEDGGLVAGYVCGMSSTSHPIVSGIHVDDCTIQGNGGFCGSILGTAFVYTTLYGCAVENTSVDAGATGYAGGIVGKLQTSASVWASYFNGTVTGSVAGGIAAASHTGKESVYNCHVDAEIIADAVAGGIIGEAARGAINHCLVEGSIQATNSSQASMGGIIGDLRPANDNKDDIIINNNLVAAEFILPSSEKVAAHRIVGYTSADMVEYDYDEEGNPYPVGNLEIEKGLAENYAVDVEPIDSKVEAVHSYTEGASISADDLTDDFMKEQDWAFGQEIDAPWSKADKLIKLYFENQDPTLGISDGIADKVSSSIEFDGTTLRTQGVISVFNAAGSQVAQALNELNAKTLPNGLYIAISSNGATLKFVVK